MPILLITFENIVLGIWESIINPYWEHIPYWGQRTLLGAENLIGSREPYWGHIPLIYRSTLFNPFQHYFADKVGWGKYHVLLSLASPVIICKLVMIWPRVSHCVPRGAVGLAGRPRLALLEFTESANRQMNTLNGPRQWRL